METQKRRGAVWGFFGWLADLRHIARLHNQLTRNGVKVRTIRPVKDGSFAALVDTGKEHAELGVLANRAGSVISGISTVAHISPTEQVLSVTLTRAA